MPAEPAESALDDPVQADDLEGRLAALDDHETPVFVSFDLGGELAALVTGIGDDGADGRPEWRLFLLPTRRDTERHAQWKALQQLNGSRLYSRLQ